MPLVKYLLNEKRADKDEKIKNGASAMTAATEAGHDAVVKYLETFDAANITNDSGAVGRINVIGEGVETSDDTAKQAPSTTTVISTPTSNKSAFAGLGSTPGSRMDTPDSSFDDSGSPKSFKAPIMSRQSTMRKERTLHDVAKLGKLKDVQVFVAKKVDLNELDRHGVTPIFYAVAQGHLEVVRYLADSGAGEDF